MSLATSHVIQSVYIYIHICMYYMHIYTHTYLYIYIYILCIYNNIINIQITINLLTIKTRKANFEIYEISYTSMILLYFINYII